LKYFGLLDRISNTSSSPSLSRYMPLAISLQHQQFYSALVQEAIDTSTVVFQFSFSKKLLHF